MRIDISKSMLNSGAAMVFMNVETGAKIGVYRLGSNSGSGKSKSVSKKNINNKKIAKKEKLRKTKKKEKTKSKIVKKNKKIDLKRDKIKKHKESVKKKKERIKNKKSKALKEKLKAEKLQEKKKLEKEKLEAQKSVEQKLKEQKKEAERLEEQKRLERERLEAKKLKEAQEKKAAEDANKIEQDKKEAEMAEKIRETEKHEQEDKKISEKLQENINVPEENLNENNALVGNIKENGCSEKITINMQELGLNPSDFEGRQVICFGRQETEAMRVNSEVAVEFAKHWSPPVGLPNDLSCNVSVSVDWTGKVTQVRFVKSSGYLAHDISVRMAFSKLTLPSSLHGKDTEMCIG